MALRIERTVRRVPEPEYLDKFFTAVGISFTLHVIAFAIMFIYSGLAPSITKPPRPKAYVVHLTDPGPLKKISRASVEKKRKRRKTVERISRKEAILPKKLVPVADKTIVLEKKKTVVKKVTKSAGKPIDNAVEEETQSVKTGGMIDIKKFPYEWYLQIMESKIYRNWDTFSVEFYVKHTVSVTIYFRVDRSGNFLEVRIERSSGDGEIDRSALEAVRRSAPLPPLPSGYIEDFLEVYFGFTLEPNR